MMVKFFEFGAAAKYPKIYTTVMVHFGMLGYRWTPELVTAAMKLFYAVSDFRRFRNMWEYVALFGPCWVLYFLLHFVPCDK